MFIAPEVINVEIILSVPLSSSHKDNHLKLTTEIIMDIIIQLPQSNSTINSLVHNEQRENDSHFSSI